jgi:hydroxyacylglutathione hydrolase
VFNTRERPTLDANLEHVLHPLSLHELLALAREGAQVLDVRHPDEYAAGHLAGSVNIGLDGQYATWAGTLLSPDRAILLIASPGREHEAALRLGRIGFDRVRGYLHGGMEALTHHSDHLAYTNRTSAPELAARMAASDPPLLIDVRTPREWSLRHIDGSMNVPLTRLRDQVSELPRDRVVALQCAGGYRSSIAASLLQQQGITDLVEVAGGLAAWDAASLPVVTASLT